MQPKEDDFIIGGYNQDFNPNFNQVTDFEKQVDKELTKIVKGKPINFIRFMLVRIGQMCVEANAETMDLKQEATIENQRYEVSCKIKIKAV